MKIIKEGSLRYERKPLQFECKNCKTVFEAERLNINIAEIKKKVTTTSVNVRCATKQYITAKTILPANKWS